MNLLTVSNDRPAESCLEISTFPCCLKIQTVPRCLHMPTPEPSPKRRPFRVYTTRDLGAAIRHYRTDAGLTQREFADRVGLHRSYLSELESGRTTEALERIMACFQELGLTLLVTPVETP